MTETKGPPPAEAAAPAVEPARPEIRHGGVESVIKALAAPFPAAAVKWKPGVVSGNRALAVCYIDARLVQDRLDEVLGPANWQDDYEVFADGSVLCRLRLGDEWVTKADVGGPSEQPDEGDRRKAAVSDALKRAAVKFGIGRYLCRAAWPRGGHRRSHAWHGWGRCQHRSRQ